MRLDDALQHFTESYSREAIQSIQDMSEKPYYKSKIEKFNVFNINESFSEFTTFLEAYKKYKIDTLTVPPTLGRETLLEGSHRRIKNEIIKKDKIMYKNIPLFIESYLTGLTKLNESIDSIKNQMLEAGVNNDSIGDINDFTDTFINRLNESFEPILEKVLWESGYYPNKALETPTKIKKEKVNFI